MHTCIKTGAVLNILEPSWFSEIDRTTDGKTHIVYGDVHLVGTCVVIYFPPKQTLEWKRRDGDIILPDTYWLRDHRSVDSVLVMEVGYISFYAGSLHPIDREAFSNAKHLWAKTQEMKS